MGLSQKTLERLAKANPLVRRLKPCYQSPKQKADKSSLCPTCGKTRGLLRSQGKIAIVQGYEQCTDCGADICSAGEAKRRKIRREEINHAAKLFAGGRVRD